MVVTSLLLRHILVCNSAHVTRMLRVVSHSCLSKNAATWQCVRRYFHRKCAVFWSLLKWQTNSSH